MDQREEFAPGLGTIAELAEHVAGDGGGVLLFDTPHHHAEVACLDHNADAPRLERILQRLGDLGGEALLDLKPAREGVHEARNLAQAEHLALGQVGHMAAAEEGQEMVLAQAEDFDVAHDHHLVVVHGEAGLVEQSLEVHFDPGGEELHGPGVALGSAAQPFAVGVFAEPLEEDADELVSRGCGNFGRHTTIVFWALRRYFLPGLLVLGLALAGCARRAAPGRPAPDFLVHLDNGRTVTLASYRGRVLVLNFWASWCPPCVQETPALNALAQRFAPQQVTVLGISIDEDPVAYQTFLARYHITFPTGRDPGQSIMHRYGTVQIPETYIVDRDGRVVRKLVSVADFNAPDMVDYLRRLAGAAPARAAAR